MLGYIVALIIYVLLLSIFSLSFILISKYLTKKVMNTSIKNHNYGLIINYIYDIYDEMVNVKEHLGTSEIEIVNKYMSDVDDLIQIIKPSNLDKVIENIKIEQKENSDEMQIDNIPECILNLFKMKSKLVIMILCHKFKYYNAYILITNEEKALKKMNKDLPKIISKLINAENEAAKKGKEMYNFDDIYKTAEFDVHKNNEKKLRYA